MEAFSIMYLNFRFQTTARHYATSRKVVGSIPDEVTDLIFPAALRVLWSTQPPTKMRNRSLSLLWGKGGRCVGLTLPPSCAECIEILGAPTYCPSLYRDCLTFTDTALYGPLTSVQDTGLPIIRAPSFPADCVWNVMAYAQKPDFGLRCVCCYDVAKDLK